MIDNELFWKKNKKEIYCEDLSTENYGYQKTVYLIDDKYYARVTTCVINGTGSYISGIGSYKGYNNSEDAINICNNYGKMLLHGNLVETYTWKWGY